MFHMLALLSAGGSVWDRLAQWYQNSLLREIFVYLKERYFTVDFRVYENLSISPGNAVMIRNLILALGIAAIATAIVTAYTRGHLGGFVRALLKADATSPKNAKTLLELGYFRSTAIRRELARGSVLRMVVRCREEEGETPEEADETIDQDETETVEREETVEEGAELHEAAETPADTSEDDGAELEDAVTEAPEKAEKTAPSCKVNLSTAHFYIPEDLRYRAEFRFNKRGSGWLQVVITTVVAVVLSSVLCNLLPELFQFADNLISWLGPN